MSSASRKRPLKPAKEGRSPEEPSARKKQTSGRISAACEACKKRKTKCTGGPPPCQSCKSLGTECVIDLSLDMRRRAALQRTIDEYKSYQVTLSELLECLRNGDPDDIESLVRSLRQDASSEETAVLIRHYVQILRKGGQGEGIEEVTGLPSDEILDSLMSDTATEQSQGFSNWGQSFSATSSLERTKTAPSQRVRQHLALLRRLRSSGDDDAEEILQRLINEQDLERFMRQALLSPDELVPSQTSWENSPVKADQEGASAPSTTASSVAGTNEGRESWHPALQVDHDSSMHERLTSSPSVNIPTRNLFNRDLPQPSTTASLKATSLQALPDPVSDKLSRPRTPARTPYAEAGNVSLCLGCSDLCVAHEDPELRWRIPLHLIQPLVVADGSAMCRVYTDYFQAAKQMLASGSPVSDVLGPSDDVVVDLLFRQRQDGDRWDCSSWACELFRSFHEYEMCVRLANTFFATRLMKWLLVPSIENYAKLPDMMKPTPAQRNVMHMGAIDLIPIPCIRDAAITELRDWLTPLGQASWTVNWPYLDQEAVEHDPQTKSLRLTTKFIAHVSEYSNWTVGSSFFETFPEVRGKVAVHA